MLPEANSVSTLYSSMGNFDNAYCRLKDDISAFHAKVGNCLSDLVESAISIIQGSVRDVKTHGSWSSNPIFDGTYSVALCFKSFLSCPIFVNGGKDETIDPVLSSTIVLCIERLLKAFSSLYLEFSSSDKNLKNETASSDASGCSSQDDKPFSLGESKSRLLDMELDVADECSDVVIGGTAGTGTFLGGTRFKMDMLSLMACCSSVLPVATWNILFDILSSESDSKVY